MKTLNEHLDDYIRVMESLNFCETTIRVRAGNIRGFFEWLKKHGRVMTPERLREDHLRKWQISLGERLGPRGIPLRPRTVNKYIESVQAFVEYLRDEGQVPAGLTHALRYVRVPRPLPRVLPHDQIRSMLDRMNTATPAGFRDRTMLEILYSSGLRATELLKMDVSEVDFKEGIALIHGKGRKERIVPVGSTALRMLESYVRAVRPGLLRYPEQPALFLDHHGERIPYHVLRRMVIRTAREAGIEAEVTAHVFRRSCTSELVRGNANLYHVSRLLGHESLDTLKHYVKLHISDLRETHHKTHPRERDEEERGNGSQGPSR